MISLAAPILTVLLGGLLVLAPLPLGGVTPAATLAIRLTALAAAALALARMPAAAAGCRRIALPLGGLALLALLAVAQTLPLPRSMARQLSPGHARLVEEAAAAQGLEGGRVPLSLAPDLSRSSAVSLACWAGLLLAGFVAGGGYRHRRWLAGALVAGAGLQLLLGLKPWLAGEVPRLSGTYANPDHVALYFEMAMAVCFAWVFWAQRPSRAGDPLEWRLLRTALPIVLWLLFFMGLAFTGSRAGLAAGLIGVATQALLLALAAGRRRLALAGLVAAALGVAVVAATGLERGFGRLLWTAPIEVATAERFDAWRASLGLVRRFPLTGTGLGTFGEAFPLVQPAEMAGVSWIKAHNDPLELLVTGGLVGSLVAAVALAGLLAALVRGQRDGLRTEDRLTALAALGAVAAVGFHELFDFGLSLPANAAALTVLLGAAAAVSLNRRRRSSPAPAPVASSPEA